MAVYSRSASDIGRSSRVVIGGCGRTGAAIAVALSASTRIIRILDVSPSAFDHLPTEVVRQGSVLPMIGDITLQSDLRAAGTQEADVFIATSASDTVNLIAAQIARHVLLVKDVICRLDDPVKRDLYQELDLTVVSHTQVLTDLVLQRV